MLPIDEHAKSGALVLIETDEKSDLLKFQWARWEEGEFATHIGWYDLKRVRGYLPASWVEHAGAMREALKDYTTRHAFTVMHILDDNATELVAATEWPPKKEGRHD